MSKQPVDYRNATWDEIQHNLTAMRRKVYELWLSHGPGTTAEVAEKTGMSILTFRPRSTELYQMGLLELLPEKKSGEGVYKAIPERNAELRTRNRQEKLAEQTLFNLSNPEPETQNQELSRKAV